MYTLRFPFALPPGKEIAVNEFPGRLGDWTYLLKRQDRFYVFLINGFLTEEAANGYIGNVWAGLMWLLLHCGLPPELVLESGNVAWSEDSCQSAKAYGFKDPVDGFVDGGQPAVYPTARRIRTVTGQPVGTLQTYHAGNVLAFFSEGATFPASAQIVSDSKLKLALELYGAYFTEISGNAKFLTLVMALESLAPTTLRTDLALRLLKKWKDEVLELRKTVAAGSADEASLEALTQNLLNQKKDSIKRSIRTLVASVLRANGDTDAESIADMAAQAYDHRSRLVHDGRLEANILGKATADAKTIVERVLRSRFLRKAKGCIDV